MNPFIRPKWALLVPGTLFVSLRYTRELRRICIQIAELNVIQQFHVNVAIVAVTLTVVAVVVVVAIVAVVGHRTMTKPKGINRTFPGWPNFN